LVNSSLKLYPALDVESTAEVVLALVDDFAPTAVEEGPSAMRLFFAASDARDAACAELRAHGYTTVPLDVSDEDWARRSQEHLKPITVGRITVFPSPESSANRESSAKRESSVNRESSANPGSQAPNPDIVKIVIVPSMGFGTGHHATTRLCLDALQRIDLTGASVLDVGTGSGVLAIAADLLGASRARGIDHDADAIQSARDNLALNPRAAHTSFEFRDLTTAALPEADVVTANLTGALLVREAPALLAATRRGGTIILSGILAEEGEAVRRAFGAAEMIAERQETEWLCLCLLWRGSLELPDA
jgi:ribosomal protein L11 methyltransferase